MSCNVEMDDSIVEMQKWRKYGVGVTGGPEESGNFYEPLETILGFAKTPSHLKQVEHVLPYFNAVCVANLQLPKQQLTRLREYFAKTEKLANPPPPKKNYWMLIIGDFSILKA